MVFPIVEMRNNKKSRQVLRHSTPCGDSAGIGGSGMYYHVNYPVITSVPENSIENHTLLSSVIIGDVQSLQHLVTVVT